jgi:uncharacterized protein YndB with AHSA1/START domain
MTTKTKFELEFPIHASTYMLFQYISTASGLAEWFADNVNSRGDVFVFIWDDVEERAKLLSKKNEERVKFQWLEDENEVCYFEMRLQVDEITKDVSLLVTDFAEEDELEEAKMIWENQIIALKHILGAI